MKKTLTLFLMLIIMLASCTVKSIEQKQAEETQKRIINGPGMPEIRHFTQKKTLKMIQ